MNLPSDIEVGIKNLLFDNFKITSLDKLLLLVKPEKLVLAQKLAVIAEDYGCMCTIALSNTHFSSIEQILNRHNIIAYLEGTISTHSKELIAYINIFPKTSKRFYRVFDFSNELFSESFKVTQEKLKHINEAIISKGYNTSKIKVCSDLGTDLEILIDKKYGWINSCGIFDGNYPGILPLSEVATYSDAINGILCADGAINTNFGFPGDPRLAQYPVYVEIVNSEIVSVKCDHIVINHLIHNFLQIKNAKRVGEIGFGTNIGLTNFLPFLCHINERFPSLHLGFGANNQGTSQLGWNCPLHLDLILKSCEVFFDEELVLRDCSYQIDSDHSKFNLESVSVSYVDTI